MNPSLLKINAVAVDTAELRREFLDFPARLYADDQNYIRPLDQDIEKVFDPKKNKLFQTGECERFLFKNPEGDTIGKVAVFVNPNYTNDQPTGGIGFFDCVNDQEVANFIFDFCKDWLLRRGMEAMDGSINFGERDQFWGVLAEGFSEPLYGMNYNAPYYPALFENYGFRLYFNQLCYSRPVHAELSRHFRLSHRKHLANPDFSVRHLRKNELEKFAKDFTEIYNLAWAGHSEGGKELDFPKVLKMFRSMKPVLDENIIWFAYHKDRPVAMWVNIPDLNQWFKYLRGKFGILQKLKFLFLKKFRKNTKMVGIVFGVVPKWQRTGVEGLMIVEGAAHIQKKTAYETTEMQWIGDFNPKMMHIAEALDTRITRRLVTYRYLFDRSREFRRHPMV